MRVLAQPQLQALLPSASDAAAVKYVRDCIGRQSRPAVRNVETQLEVLESGRHSFPVSGNSGGEFEHNSHVVSSSNTYSVVAAAGTAQSRRAHRRRAPLGGQREGRCD